MKALIGRSPKMAFTGAVLVFVVLYSVGAQQQPFMDGGTAQVPPFPPSPPTEEPVGVAVPHVGSTNALAEFLTGKKPGLFLGGKFNLNVRLRYEQVDEDHQPPYTENSYAPTIRTRFGYTTASFYGFQAMAEGVNVSVLGPEHNYNAAGSNHEGDRPPVGDPPLTRLDQAWLSYAYSNYFQVKAGEQQINIDNRRFIGDVGWRQNMQTYEAAAVRGEPVDHLALYYAYVWQVHRVFGNVPGLPPANTDFSSSSHLINVSYSGWDYGRFVGYAYLLDLSNDAGNANSCATYGGYFAGAAPVSDKLMLGYRAEFAWQQQYADSPLRYDALYYNLEGGAHFKPFALGAGYEVLGSGANSGAGGGQASFRTPLATLHAFNGWDDVFLSTPSDGLRDLYAYAQVTFPAQIPVSFVYHKFDADHGGGNYGQEFDLLLVKKLGRFWNVLLEYAVYLGQDAAVPSLTAANVTIQKFWAAVELNF